MVTFPCVILQAVYLLAGSSTAKKFGRIENKLSHLAATSGHTAVLQKLTELFQSMILNERNKQRQTPLMLAAENGHIEAVEFLVDSGARLNFKDITNETALHKAAGNGHLDIVEYLIDKGANPNLIDKNGDTILHKAIMKNKFDVVEGLLNLNNIEVDKPNSQGYTPLLLALWKGTEDMVDILMDFRANVWVEGNDGNTALHFAAISNKITFMERLLHANIKYAERQNNYGNRPLHLAASSNRREAARVLVEKGADLNARNNQKETPLHVAARNDAKDVAEILLKCGADHLAMDNNFLTARKIAEVNRYFQTAYLISVSVNTPGSRGTNCLV